MRLWPRVKSNTGSPDVERCKHVKSRATTGVFQARQAKASIYICTTDVGNNRSRDGRGGKHGRNRFNLNLIFLRKTKILRPPD